MNAADAAVAAIGYGESVLTLGQAAAEWLDELDVSRSTRLEGACSSAASTRTVALSDADGNGRPSAGDRVEITLADCYVRTLDDPFTGTLTITLTAPTSASTRWVGSIDLGSGLGIGSDFKLKGALRFEALADGLSQMMKVQSASTPLTAEYVVEAKVVTDVLTGIDATKEVRRDTAQAMATLRLRAASDLLGGAIEVSTETPFRAWFDTYPDAGVVAVSGTGANTLHVRALGAESQLLGVELTGAAATTIVARSAADGYLWSSTGLIPADPRFNGYNVQLGSSQPFRALTKPDPATVLPATAVLKWQLSRPLASGVTAQAEFRAQRPSQWGAGVIAASVVLEGAFVTITPAAQLEPGMVYALGQISVAPAEGTGFVLLDDTFTVVQSIDVSAQASGARSYLSVPLLYGSTGSVNVEAVAIPGAGLGPVTVRWRQVSGPPVLIEQETALRSRVSASAQTASAPAGLAVLEVEARASNGDIDHAQVQFQVAGDINQATVFGYRIGMFGPYTSGVLLDPTPGDNSSIPVKLHTGNLLDIIMGGRVFIKPPAPIVWADGLRYDIVRSAGSTDSEAIHLLGPDQGTCEATTGSIVVADFATDSSGGLLRMALDYTFNCSDGRSVSGFLRLHSAVPEPTTVLVPIPLPG